MNNQQQPHIERSVTPDNGNQLIITLLRDNTSLLLDSMNNRIYLWRNLVNSFFNYNQNMNQHQTNLINYFLQRIQEIEVIVNNCVQQFFNVNLHSLDDIIQINQNTIDVELHVKDIFIHINNIMIQNNILLNPHEILPLGGGKKYKRTKSKKNTHNKKKYSKFTIKK